jgi:hypothetical protein
MGCVNSMTLKEIPQQLIVIQSGEYSGDFDTEKKESQHKDQEKEEVCTLHVYSSLLSYSQHQRVALNCLMLIKGWRLKKKLK